MLTENFKAACSAAAAAIPRDPADPLMKQLILPENCVDKGFQSLFMSIAYYLKFKVKQAKESELKKFGVMVKSKDQFMFGGYITILDNGGEDSVNLDFTYNPDDFKDMIEAGQCIDIDDPSFTPYVSSSTAKVVNPDGTESSFYIVSDYIHTLFVILTDVLKNHIEGLLDASQNPDDCTVSLEGIFEAKGSVKGNEKFIAVNADEMVRQIIKNDDLNEVA